MSSENEKASARLDERPKTAKRLQRGDEIRAGDLAMAASPPHGMTPVPAEWIGKDAGGLELQTYRISDGKDGRIVRPAPEIVETGYVGKPPEARFGAEGECAAEPKLKPDQIIQPGDFRKVNRIDGGIAHEPVKETYVGFYARDMKFEVFRPHASVLQMRELASGELIEDGDVMGTDVMFEPVPKEWIGTKFQRAGHPVLRPAYPIRSKSVEEAPAPPPRVLCCNCEKRREECECPKFNVPPEHEHVSGSFTVSSEKAVWAPDGGPVQEHALAGVPAEQEHPTANCTNLDCVRGQLYDEHGQPTGTLCPDCQKAGRIGPAGEEGPLGLSDGPGVLTGTKCVVCGIDVAECKTYFVRGAPLGETPALWRCMHHRPLGNKVPAPPAWYASELNEARAQDHIGAGRRLAKCGNCNGLLYEKDGHWFHDGAICATFAKPVNIYDPALDLQDGEICPACQYVIKSGACRCGVRGASSGGCCPPGSAPGPEWPSQILTQDNPATVSNESEVYACLAERPRFWQRLANRLFPKRYVTLPEAPATWQDVIHFRAVTQFSVADLARVLLSKKIEIVAQIACEKTVGQSMSRAEVNVLPPFLEHPWLTVRETPVNEFNPAPRAGLEVGEDPSGIHTNPDAMAWTQFFTRTVREVALRNLSDNPNPSESEIRAEIGSIAEDEGYMIGWFANAMMAMHDFERGKKEPVLGLLFVFILGIALGAFAAWTILATS